MQTEFKVGDRVRDDERGYGEGVVRSVSDAFISVCFNHRTNYSYSLDGKWLGSSEITLTHIEEQPKTVRRKVRSDLKENKQYGGVVCTKTMTLLVGQEVSATLTRSNMYKVPEDNSGFAWTEEMFEPIQPEPSKIVLSEWQEKEISTTLNWIACNDINEADGLKNIKSILSAPEPPKWEPKEGEVCLFREEDSDGWIADAFDGMCNDSLLFKSKGCGFKWNQCRPFDANLIGTTDNPNF